MLITFPSLLFLAFNQSSGQLVFGLLSAGLQSVLSRFRESKPPIRHPLSRCLGSAVRTENLLKTKASKVHPCGTQGTQMNPNQVPLVSKMVFKMTPKPHPGPLRTRPKKKRVFLMHFHPRGTLKIIKRAILSSILRFSQYSTSASKYHSPGLFLEHFSAPAGIEKVPWTRYKTFRNLSLKIWSPRLQGFEKLLQVAQ